MALAPPFFIMILACLSEHVLNCEQGRPQYCATYSFSRNTLFTLYFVSLSNDGLCLLMKRPSCPSISISVCSPAPTLGGAETQQDGLEVEITCNLPAGASLFSSLIHALPKHVTFPCGRGMKGS